MDHPWTGLVEHRALWLGALWISTIVLMVVLMVQGRDLARGAGPRGVLSFELSWNRAGAEAVLASWPGELRDRAKQQIGIDFAFLAIYPLALSLSCARLSESPLDTMAPVGVFLAWAVLVAGPLDLVENLAMLRMLGRGASDTMARLASWCAGVKFTLVYAALGYLVLQSLVVLFGGRRG